MVGLWGFQEDTQHFPGGKFAKAWSQTLDPSSCGCSLHPLRRLGDLHGKNIAVYQFGQSIWVDPDVEHGIVYIHLLIGFGGCKNGTSLTCVGGYTVVLKSVSARYHKTTILDIRYNRQVELTAKVAMKSQVFTSKKLICGQSCGTIWKMASLDC